MNRQTAAERQELIKNIMQVRADVSKAAVLINNVLQIKELANKTTEEARYIQAHIEILLDCINDEIAEN